ncbi:MAG: hypothetical protein BWY75_03418 [bacterium ADurb.Bin425]|nr:MAG: hypothetical protein BWY75_03418 [bacterium ADurb.Bin425]
MDEAFDALFLCLIEHSSCPFHIDVIKLLDAAARMNDAGHMKDGCAFCIFE